MIRRSIFTGCQPIFIRQILYLRNQVTRLLQNPTTPFVLALNNATLLSASQISRGSYVYFLPSSNAGGKIYVSLPFLSFLTIIDTHLPSMQIHILYSYTLDSNRPGGSKMKQTSDLITIK